MRDLLLLWSKAAARCCFPDCKILLYDNLELVGHAAHIIAHAESGPRGRSAERFRVESYDNLILLCAHHHMTVDKNHNAYPPDTLKAWKAEHESWVKSMTEPKQIPLRWTLLLLEDQPSIDRKEAEQALDPGNLAAATRRLTTPEEAAEVIAKTHHDERRYAVFCLTRIPQALHLGFVLGDRGRVRLYHYHRDQATWRWPEKETKTPIAVTHSGKPSRSVTLRISLSAQVPKQPIPNRADIHISVPKPSVRWLKSENQLTALAQVYGQVQEEIRNRSIERVHLYYAGPAAGAVLFGRLYNPRMNPPLDIYDYAGGEYTKALTLNP